MIVIVPINDSRLNLSDFFSCSDSALQVASTQVLMQADECWWWQGGLVMRLVIHVLLTKSSYRCTPYITKTWNPRDMYDSSRHRGSALAGIPRVPQLPLHGMIYQVRHGATQRSPQGEQS